MRNGLLVAFTATLWIGLAALAFGPALNNSSAKFADEPKVQPAQDFAKEFATNEKDAAKKYKNKTIFVEGVVSELRDGKSGGKSVVLTGFKSGKETINILCHIDLIDKTTKEIRTTLKVGDKVKIKGEFVVDPEVVREEGKPSVLKLLGCTMVK